MRIISDIDSFYKRKILPGFKIKKEELVIDIGSGDKPFWRADVFLDKLSLGNAQRSTHKDTISSMGVFVDGDCSNMPFKNKAFDFSYCAHLLEHVEDPQKAIKEIERISERGYIEVPNAVSEVIQPFSPHLWLVLLDKDKLIFIRKDKFLHTAFCSNSLNYQYLQRKMKNPFIQYFWKDNIKCEVYDNTNGEKYEGTDCTEDVLEETAGKFSSYLFVVKILRSLFYIDKKNEVTKLTK
jgi:ubiquinone/menaquinone biosynthesis C-methylase UbiE